VCRKGILCKTFSSNYLLCTVSFAKTDVLYFKGKFTRLGNRVHEFLSLERGQLIFKRALLVPAKMNFKVRSGKIKESD